MKISAHKMLLYIFVFFYYYNLHLNYNIDITRLFCFCLDQSNVLHTHIQTHLKLSLTGSNVYKGLKVNK